MPSIIPIKQLDPLVVKRSGTPSVNQLVIWNDGVSVNGTPDITYSGGYLNYSRTQSGSSVVMGISNYSADADSGARLQLYSSGGESYISLTNVDSGNKTWAFGVDRSNGHRFIFGNHGTLGSNQAMVIEYVGSSDGRLGVNTIAPSETIDCAGGIRLGSAKNTNNGTIQWDGTNLQVRHTGAWINLDESIPAGFDTQVQFNNSGAMAGSYGLTYNDTNRYFQVSRTATAADAEIRVSNSVIDTSANAILRAVVNAGGGDPALILTSGGDSFYTAIDNSDSDIFKLGYGSAVGSNVALSIVPSATPSILVTNSLSVGNQVKVGAVSGTPAAGMIQWDGSNFKGYSGSTWVNLDSAGGGSITGSGTSGQITFWNSSSNITSEAALAWDASIDRLTVTGDLVVTTTGSDSVGNVISMTMTNGDSIGWKEALDAQVTHAPGTGVTVLGGSSINLVTTKSGLGTITNMQGMVSARHQDSGHITSTYGLQLGSLNQTGGTADEDIVLKIPNHNEAATNNWNIYTGTGKIYFGDAIQINAFSSGTATAGMLQWDGTDFKGYYGAAWIRLAKEAVTNWTIPLMVNGTLNDSALLGNGSVTCLNFKPLQMCLWDSAHELRYAGATSTFASVNPDGPALYGYSGGLLGTAGVGGELIALQWNSSQNVYCSNDLNAVGDISTVTGDLRGKTLRIFQTDTLGAADGSYNLVSRLEAESSNQFLRYQYIVRKGTGTTWITARWHDCIGIDTSFYTPGTDTKCWWERDPNTGIHYWGNGASTYMTLDSSKLILAGDLQVGAIYSGSHPLSVSLSGGTVAGSGGNIEVFGASHASYPNQVHYDALYHYYTVRLGARLTLT